jgi:hypothetical protein
MRSSLDLILILNTVRGKEAPLRTEIEVGQGTLVTK